MKLTFNGIVIAAEPDFSGFDSIVGFDAEGEQAVQEVELLRAAWRLPIARGNCRITLAGEIRPAPSATLAARLAAMEMVFVTIPKSGLLTKQVGTQQSNYPIAVLQSFRALKDALGVSYGYALTFVVGAPQLSSATPVLESPSGTPLLSPTGQPLIAP